MDFFVFASEIKVLLKNKIVKNSIELNYEKVIEFIAHRNLNRANQTLIKNIKILNPGNFVEYDLNLKKFEIRKFEFTKKEIQNYSKKKQFVFDEVFKKSLQYLTITKHKKIACLLSGGLDSSLLSIILNSQNKYPSFPYISSLLKQLLALLNHT